MTYSGCIGCGEHSNGRLYGATLIHSGFASLAFEGVGRSWIRAFTGPEPGSLTPREHVACSKHECRVVLRDVLAALAVEREAAR